VEVDMARTKKAQAEIDNLASLRTQFEIGSQERAGIQNRINKLAGSKVHHEFFGVPRSRDIALAKSTKAKEAVAVRATKATKAAEGLSSGDLVTKALAGLKAPKEDKKPKKGNKTRSDLNKMLGGM
jgi:hypothetical protein